MCKTNKMSKRSNNMEHVVYCDSKNNELDKIINKEKTMLIRANQSRRIPHSRVFKGEKLYFTNKNSNVINYEAEVKEVYNYNKLFNHEIDKIINNYNEKLYIFLCSYILLKNFFL